MPDLRLCSSVFALILLIATAAPADGLFLDLTIEEALARAKAEEKIVFIDFFTENYGPGKRLDASTFSDGEVSAWLGAHTVPLKIDADKEKENAKRYYVRSKSTLVFLRADGVELGRIHGFRPPGSFLETAAAMIEHPEKDAVARAREELDQGRLPRALSRRNLAYALAASGKPDQALAELSKALDELGTDRESRSQRVMLLKSVCVLSVNYPPAGAEMVKLRGELVQRIEAGEADASDVEQITAIDQGLDQEGRTLELYQTLKAEGTLSPELTAGFVSQCREMLLEDRQYEALEAEIFGGLRFQVLSQVFGLKTHRDRVRGDYRKYPEEAAEKMREQVEHMSEEQRKAMFAAFETELLGRIGETYQIACGLGKIEIADLAAQRLLEVAPTAEAYHVLAVNALRSGKPAGADLEFAGKALELDKGAHPEYVLTRYQLLEHCAGPGEAQSGTGPPDADPQTDGGDEVVQEAGGIH